MALAVLGAILPVMPTTIFLIVAVYCFARSSPALGRKLLGARIFRPYMRYVYGERRLSGKVRFFLILWVWAGVASSMLILARRGRLAPWIVVVAVSFGILSTLGFILSGRTGAPGGLSGEARPR